MAASQNWPFVVNLGNSIIGVAMLAMPFCFQQCGIILSMLVLFFCTWLTIVSCKILMKAGVTSRRRSYEFLAYHTLGSTGKLVAEIGMIGFQLGTLIAQIVVIGDLGPGIVTKILGIPYSSGLRTALMIILCMTIGLPMALIRDIRAVSRVSTICVSFYCIFVLYVVYLALPNLLAGDWIRRVHFWRPRGLFQSLPILSFAFGCQAQVFLLYDALPEPSLKIMSRVVNSAVSLCAVGYLMVGFCGCIAFYSTELPGDVIAIFPTTFFTDVMKVCFVFSIVITFPVIVFPCRASIYTLLYAKPHADETFDHLDDEKSKVRDDMIDLETYMPAKQLKIITTSLVVGSTVVGVLIPNVEFILGLNGSVMGTLICYIFPALFFLKVMGNKPEGRNLALLVLLVGMAIMLVSTYATLNSPQTAPSQLHKVSHDSPLQPGLYKQAVPLKVELAVPKSGLGDPVISKPGDSQNLPLDVRQEPPNPDPPNNRAKRLEDIQGEGAKLDNGLVTSGATIDTVIAANRAKELELERQKKQEDLLAQLERQSLEQKKILEEQKQILREFKDHHQQDLQLQQVNQNVPVVQAPSVINLQQADPRNLQPVTQLDSFHPQPYSQPQQPAAELLQPHLNQPLVSQDDPAPAPLVPAVQQPLANSSLFRQTDPAVNLANDLQSERQLLFDKDGIMKPELPAYVRDINRDKREAGAPNSQFRAALVNNESGSLRTGTLASGSNSSSNELQAAGSVVTGLSNASPAIKNDSNNQPSLIGNDMAGKPPVINNDPPVITNLSPVINNDPSLINNDGTSLSQVQDNAHPQVPGFVAEQAPASSQHILEINNSLPLKTNEEMRRRLKSVIAEDNQRVYGEE